MCFPLGSGGGAAHCRLGTSAAGLRYCELCSNPWRVVATCAGREGRCAAVGLGLKCGMYTSLPTQPLETHDELEPCT